MKRVGGPPHPWLLESSSEVMLLSTLSWSSIGSRLGVWDKFCWFCGLWRRQGLSLKGFPFREREAPVRGSRLDFPKGKHCLLTDPQSPKGELFILPKPGLLCTSSFLPPTCSLGGSCYWYVRGSLQFKTQMWPFSAADGEPLVLVRSFPCPFISTPCPRTLDMWIVMITLWDIPSFLSLRPFEWRSDNHYYVYYCSENDPCGWWKHLEGFLQQPHQVSLVSHSQTSSLHNSNSPPPPEGTF